MVLMVSITGILFFGVTTTATAQADANAVVRGGRLYDNWYRELHLQPPRSAHPLLAKRPDAASAIAEPWRCTSCHGWDYRGVNGMPGIERYQGADPEVVVTILTSAGHAYGDILRPEELLALGHFVSAGQVDMTALIQSGTVDTAPGVASHEDRFATICSGCHGHDGKRVREVPPLGEVARDRPREALHMILNGHPGGNMPPLRVLGTTNAAGMLAYLRQLPAQNLAASIVRGGRLYDNWQQELQALPPPVPHPAYPADAGYAEDAPRTWRCKECHGWDYRGRDGSYGVGPHATGITGIQGYTGSRPEEIIELLRNSTHRYGAVLKYGDLVDLARFISMGQLDMDTVIERETLRVRGDASRATDYFGTICATCHGRDGRGIMNTIPLGRLAKTSPWEALHKIRNGHPNEPMPALQVLDDQLLVDILAYLQTLPEGR
jgi:mono/diheme cytochrome c family protein